MFQEILNLLVRIDAALTAIAGRLDPNGLSAAQVAQIRDALAALAGRAESIATGTTVSLSLNLPTTIPGGNTTTGSVGIASAVSTDTPVNLASSDPALILPATAVIPAGQLSIAFQISTTNPATDTNVTVTASVRGGAQKTASVMVTRQ